MVYYMQWKFAITKLKWINKKQEKKWKKKLFYKISNCTHEIRLRVCAYVYLCVQYFTKNQNSHTKTLKNDEIEKIFNEIIEWQKKKMIFFFKAKFTLQLKMYHVYDHLVTANCAVEYSDSYSFVTYIHLAQLSSGLASHNHLSMSQLICIGMGEKNETYFSANVVSRAVCCCHNANIQIMLTGLWRIVVTECFVFRNIGIKMDTLIQIFDTITKWTDGKIFVAKRL